jgi:transposase InsO family protein
MDLWAYQNGAKIDFSRPGNQTGNAFIESFNGTFRDECLYVHRFETLAAQNRATEAGGRNTMGIVLKGISRIGRHANSPVNTRLAAYSLQPEPVEGQHSVWQERLGP